MKDAMPLHVYESVDELLEPRTLAGLLGVPVQGVERVLYDVPHMSGNRLERVIVAGEGEPITLVLKCFDAERDWVMRLTHDDLVREVTLYRNGVYAGLPKLLDVPMIAAARDGGTWVSLMRDVSDTLPPAALPTVAAEDAETWLKHLALLHGHFWNDAALTRPELGLSSLYDFLTILSPARVRGELDAGRGHPVLEMAAKGWAKFDAEAPSDVRDIVHDWQNDPAPLLAELEALPQTLVHGDFKLANLGIATEPSGARRSVILDWQDATRGAGVLDLGYFLALNGLRLPILKTDAIAMYKRALAEQGLKVSTKEIELGLVAGGALRLLWLMVTTGQRDVGWWYEVVRRVAARSAK